MADRHLSEADVMRDLRQRLLVLRIFAPMHQRDSDGAIAIVKSGLQDCSCLRPIQRHLDSSVRQNALVYF